MNNKRRFVITLICAIILFTICAIILFAMGMSYSCKYYSEHKKLIVAQENLQTEAERNEELSQKISDIENDLDLANMTIKDLKSDEYELVYMGDFKLSYYCDEHYPHICEAGIGKTASGKATEIGWTVAADTSVIPMGSIIYIEGFGFREVMDVGGGVKGQHIDILVDTHANALSMGVNHGGVWILVKKS